MAFLSTNTWAPGDEITSDQMNDLDAKTVAAIDGVAGGTYAAPLDFSNLVGLTVNGLSAFNDVATFNGFVTLNQNVTLDTANFTVTSGSGIGIQGGGFLTLANLATANFQSGSTTNYQGGSNLVHANGSVDTYQSGATLTQNSGSTATFGGILSVTGTLSCAVGSTVSFISVPTFLFGLNINAGTTSVAGILTVSAATTISGTTNLSGTTTIVGASNRLKLTPRAKTKRVSLSKAQPGNALFNGGLAAPSPTYNPVSDSITIAATTTFPITTTQTVTVDLDPPHGSTLQDVEFVWGGSGSIVVEVRRSGALIVDIPPTTTPGTITLSPNIAVDTENHTYTAVFEVTTAGTDFATLTRLKRTCLISEYDEG